MLRKLREIIAAAPVITIFRHVHPDMDAIGSQLGLQKAIQTLYPDKQVYVLGNESRENVPMDVVDDEVVKHSLAILLDTSNADRIDDARYLSAQTKMRLDHHVKVEDLADYDYVDDKASATGEILAQLLAPYEIGREAAQHLYEALTSDNIRFTTGNTRPESLQAGAWLLSQGADVIRCELDNHACDFNAWQYENKVKTRACRKGNVLFAVMEENDYLSCGLTQAQAKDKVYCLGGIRDITIWALFTRNQDGTYNGSLRSRDKDVRQVAVEFGGGGHICAAGIKGLSGADVQAIVQKLAAFS